MCFFSHSGYRFFYKLTPFPRKSTFRYDCMFNFIPVSFCFVANFRVRVRVRVSYRVRDRVRDRQPKKIFDRWRCRHSGRSRPLDACVFTSLLTKNI